MNPTPAQFLTAFANARVAKQNLSLAVRDLTILFERIQKIVDSHDTTIDSLNTPITQADVNRIYAVYPTLYANLKSTVLDKFNLLP